MPEALWSGGAIAGFVAVAVAAAPLWSELDRTWLKGICGRVTAWLTRLVLKPARDVADRVITATGHERALASLGEACEMIDVVRLGLSAGLSFDAALELYCTGRKSALARRMGEAMLAWRMGVSTREEALLAAARDSGVRALESFATVSSQAIELGAPLAETLAGQSREIRAAHRAAVEREIERVPVKLLIPTGTLILPALLLSIIGPLLAASGMV